MECDKCKEQLQNWPENWDKPKCAFEENKFNPDNWNCGTVRELRALAKKYDEHEGQKCSLINISNLDITEDDINFYDFMIISWYKNRGRTEGIWIVSESRMKFITLEVAKQIIERMGK